MKESGENIFSRNVKKSIDSCASGLSDELRSGSDKYFDLRPVKYRFGTRMVYFKKEQEMYEILQSSRCGMESSRKQLSEFMIEAQDKILDFKESDMIRFSELDSFLKSKGILKDVKLIAELGFRIPIVLKKYKDLGYRTKDLMS